MVHSAESLWRRWVRLTAQTLTPILLLTGTVLAFAANGQAADRARAQDRTLTVSSTLAAGQLLQELDRYALSLVLVAERPGFGEL